MKDEHMEAQHDTDGGSNRAELRTARKKGFHKAAAAYFKARVVWNASAGSSDEGVDVLIATGKAADDAFKAWKNAH